MTGIESLISVALLATAAATLLKGLGFRGAAIFSAAVMTLMLGYAISSARPVFELIGGIADGSAEYTQAAVKIVGIGYATGITADICRELGENGIARAVLFGAKIEMILIALPHVYRITELAVELMGGGGA